MRINFDIVKLTDDKFADLVRWIFIECPTCSIAKGPDGSVVGLDFNDEEDAVAFKLRFELHD